MLVFFGYLKIGSTGKIDVVYEDDVFIISLLYMLMKRTKIIIKNYITSPQVHIPRV